MFCFRPSFQGEYKRLSRKLADNQRRLRRITADYYDTGILTGNPERRLTRRQRNKAHHYRSTWDRLQARRNAVPDFIYLNRPTTKR